MLERECDVLNFEYRDCLRLHGSDLSRCSNIEAQLKQCAETYAKNYCIEDVTQLVQCVKKPGPTLCAAEFLRMRECNRSEGRQLYISDTGKLTSTKEQTALLPGSLCMHFERQPRSSIAVAHALDSLKRRLNLKNFSEQVEGYKWDYGFFRHAGE